LKLIDHNALKAGEQKLIEFIAANLNWKSIREVIQNQYNIEALKDITIDSGRIIRLENEIAYQLNLGPQTGVSVLLSQSGEFIKIIDSEGASTIKKKLSRPDEEVLEEQAAMVEASVMTSGMPAMISKINRAAPVQTSNDED